MTLKWPNQMEKLEFKIFKKHIKKFLKRVLVIDDLMGICVDSP